MEKFDSMGEVLKQLKRDMAEYDYYITYGKETKVRSKDHQGPAKEVEVDVSDSLFYVPLDLNFYNEESHNGVTGYDIMRAMMYENFYFQENKKWPWEKEEDPRNEELLHVYEKSGKDINE